MFVIVIHDSFVHELPFYYFLYAIGGLMVGRFVAFTQKVMIAEDKKTLTLKVKPIGMLKLLQYGLIQLLVRLLV